MLNNKISKYFLIILSSSTIAFGVKIDGFKDRTVGKDDGMPVIISDTELNGTVQRYGLSREVYNFHTKMSDPDQTLVNYFGTNKTESIIDYRVNNGFDLNANPIFRFNFSSVSKDFSIQIMLTDSNAIKRTSNNIGAGLKNLNPSIDLSQNSNFTDSKGDPFNPSEVQFVQFTMNADSIQHALFNLDSIEAVPEPFSMISLGIGITGLVRKKRKNMRKNIVQ